MHAKFEGENLKIEHAVSILVKWVSIMWSNLNTTKTKFICFKTKKKRHKHRIGISINDQNIEQFNQTTFLGVIIDENVTWHSHLNLIYKKIMKSTTVISKIRHFTNLNTRKLLYYSLVYPYLTYGNLIWGNTYKKRIQKLINIQKKIIRLITFKSYTEHTEPLFRNLEILNFENINDYLICLFMFRYYYLENLPEVFSNYFTRNDEIHHYNTRTSSQLHVL